MKKALWRLFLLGLLFNNTTATVCTDTTGTGKNVDSLIDCVCGTTTCIPSQYCNSEHSICSATAIHACSYKDGTQVNEYPCICGEGLSTEACGAGGFFCNEVHTINKCHKQLCSTYSDTEALCDADGYGAGVFPDRACAQTTCYESDRDWCCKTCARMDGFATVYGKCRMECPQNGDVCKTTNTIYNAAPPTQYEFNGLLAHQTMDYITFIADLNPYYFGYCNSTSCAISDAKTCCLKQKTCGNENADTLCVGGKYNGLINKDAPCPTFECTAVDCCNTQTCTCVNGTGAIGTNCIDITVPKCTSCHSEFWLNEDTCIPATVCNDEQWEFKVLNETSDRQCRIFDTCDSDEYITRHNTTTTNRECATIRPKCSLNEYQSVKPIALNGQFVNNRECATLTPICNMTIGKYQSIAPLEFDGQFLNNRECATLTSPCSGDTYQKTTPIVLNGQFINNRECATLTPPCSGDTYQSVAPNKKDGHFTSNRECSSLTICNSSEYEKHTFTNVSDRQCLNQITCKSYEYERIPPIVIEGKNVSDRTCTDITVCNISEYQSIAPEPHKTNRICSTCDKDDQNCAGCRQKENCAYNPLSLVSDVSSCAGSVCHIIIINETTIPVLNYMQWVRFERQSGSPTFSLIAPDVISTVNYSYFRVPEDYSGDIILNNHTLVVRQDCEYGEYTCDICDRQCGLGNKFCIRGDQTKQTKNGGKTCTQVSKEMPRFKPESCLGKHCPSDCEYTWENKYGQCSASCGQEGLKYKIYTVHEQPKYGGKTCPQEYVKCITPYADKYCNCQNQTQDNCGVCGGDDSTCKGCDGVPNSHKILNPCGVCTSRNTPCNLATNSRAIKKKARSKMLNFWLPTISAILLFATSLAIIAICTCGKTENRIENRTEIRKKRKL